MRRSVFACLSILGILTGVGFVTSGVKSVRLESAKSCVEAHSTPIDSPKFFVAYRDALERLKKLPRKNLHLLNTCFDNRSTQEELRAGMMALSSMGAVAGSREGQDYRVRATWSKTNITWSLRPDSSGLDLFSVMDAKFAAHGGRAKWTKLVEQCFARWSQLSGLKFQQEKVGGNVWDDGSPSDSPGVPGVRGDIRISGFPYDGARQLLAYAYYPPDGDIFMDTSEDWGNPESEFRFFRNVLMHEIGHALGLAHVCPTDKTKLMEPFLTMTLAGVSHDDARGVQSMYADPYEPNQTLAQASDLMYIPVPGTISTDSLMADPAEVAGSSPTDVSSLSLQSATTDDYYRVVVESSGLLKITVRPVGRLYQEGPQATDGSCGTTTLVNSFKSIPLDVQFGVYASGAVLGQSSSTVAGNAVSMEVNLPSAGEYFLRVKGPKINFSIQQYAVDFETSLPEGNLPPAISGPEEVTIDEWEPASIQFSAVDPEGAGQVDWSLGSTFPRATINENGVVTFTSTDEDGGTEATLYVIATDKGTPASSAAKKVKIRFRDFNSPPSITNAGPLSGDEGVNTVFTLTASDYDSPKDTLKWSIPEQVPGATINASTGVLTYRPSELDGGSVKLIRVRVTDNGSPNLWDEKVIPFTVNETNSPPGGSAGGSVFVAAGKSLAMTITGIDSDIPKQTLTLSLKKGPVGMMINPATGALTWQTTTTTSPGQHDVEIEISDGIAVGLLAFKVTVFYPLRGVLQIDGIQRPTVAIQYRLIDDQEQVVQSGVFAVNSQGGYEVQVPMSMPSVYRFEADSRCRIKAVANGIVFNAGAQVGTLILGNGDANDDGSVDLLDYFILSDTYLQKPIFLPSADFNMDGVVNLVDYDILGRNFGRSEDE